MSRCRSSALVLKKGPLVSPETGEHALSFRVVNASSRSCSVRGYPHIHLKHGRRTLHFDYVHGGEYTTHRKPTTHVLKSGGRTIFVVAKYRCDVGPVTPATKIKARVPSTSRSLSRHLGSRTLDACSPANSHASRVVDVSPLVRHLTSALNS